MTHAELVERAARWLRNTRKCGVVLTEFHSASVEIPDAIGWNASQAHIPRSILVECKTSLSDFYSDGKKPGRKGRTATHGIGRERYYLAPPDILTAELVRRNRPKWGLLEAWPKSIRVKLNAESFCLQTAWRELPVLYSFARRISQYGLTLSEAQDAVRKAAG